MAFSDMISCPTAGPDAADAPCTASSCWEELPPAFLCHILQLVPYKRCDVKAVCAAWRAAINSSITEASLPAHDLQLLRQLTSVQQLTVTGGQHHQHHQHQHAQAAGELCHQLQLCTTSAAWPPSSRPAVSSWSAVQPKTFRRLSTLRLKHCPAAVQQLAARLSSSSTNPGCEDALSSLQTLELCQAGDISQLLPELLRQCGPAAKLQQLCLTSCSLSGPHHQQLPQLQQLVALRVLDLTGCGLLELPVSICGATGLTQLVLRNNLMHQLPPEVGRLQQLKVLDLSGCTQLRGLCSSFRQLTALQELHLAGPSGVWLNYSSIKTDSSSSSTSSSSTADPLHPWLPTGCSSSSSNATGSNTGSGGSAAAAAARAALPPLLPALPHQQQVSLLPELASLSRLSHLNLAGNRQLMVLPSCLSLLGALRLLDVRGCGIRWLGDDLLECSGLQILLLSDNVLAEVPEEIRRLQQLQVLDLGACTSLWRLPGSLLQLPALVRLTLPSRGVGQHIVEQLELRAAPEVEVLLDPAEGLSEEEEQQAAPGPDDSDDDSDSGSNLSSAAPQAGGGSSSDGDDDD